MKLQQGFTLVEVMLATAILAVIGAISAVGISSMINSKTITEEKSLVTSELQTTLSQLTTDFGNVALVRHTTAVDWDGRVLRFTRRDPLTRELYVAGWSVMDSPEGKMLARWKSPNIRSISAWKKSWDDAAIWARSSSTSNFTYLIPASDIRVSFWTNGWVNPQSTNQPDTLPSGVQIQVFDGEKSWTKIWYSPIYSSYKS